MTRHANRHHFTADMVAGRDFGVLWSGGRTAIAGLFRHASIVTLFSPSRFGNVVKADWPILHGQRLWSYPPTMMPVMMVFGGLPLIGAAALYVGVGIMVMSLAVAAAMDIRRDLACLIVLMAPGTWDCILAGQDSLIIGALVIAGIMRARRYPVLAGMLLGLATAKPQLGMSTPAALIGQKAWKAIFVAIVSVGVMAVLTSLLWPGAWGLWLSHVVPVQMARMDRPYIPTPSQAYSGSLYEFMRAEGLGEAASSFVSAIASGLAMFGVAVVFRRASHDRERRVALLASLALLPVASPWLMDYDFAAIQPIAIALIFQGRDIWEFGPSKYLLIIAILASLVLPEFGFILSLRTGVAPIAPLVISMLGLAAIVASWQWRQE
ncbi:hypothetical protein ACMV_00570 [Acidiphilium multivorum AIU301]|uniref:DUF2029 domain-containing protein n=2 Tax=Acidiphilium multivorum TaxID=62140 RepID=F0J122_ACIMA|nr:hypothetical protein ACMV_00570 [Acidiphilium multivorum AIU301]